MCFIVLHCASLCSTVLHCAPLCSTVLHKAASCCTICCTMAVGPLRTSSSLCVSSIDHLPAQDALTALCQVPCICAFGLSLCTVHQLARRAFLIHPIQSNATRLSLSAASLSVGPSNHGLLRLGCMPKTPPPHEQGVRP